MIKNLFLIKRNILNKLAFQLINNRNKKLINWLIKNFFLVKKKPQKSNKK